MQTVCASGMDHQMKGEYFKMKNHGLRRIFSLFLALFMVFTLLPTTALAEDTTGADGTQPKTVAVDGGEKKTDPPAQEQPKNENPPAPEDPKTFTVTYTDGVGGAVFDNDVHSNLPSGTATPAFSGSLAREGYTFVGWNPAVAETVTADVTYAAKWEEGKTNARRVPLPTIPKPDIAPADLNTGHKIDVRFTVLYVGDEFNIGYNYGSSEKTKFVCQYKTNHSDTAYNNHTIAISDIKAAASRASVNSGYQIVGWSKESNANPTTWSLNKSGTTACNKGSTIYLVAKNPNPTTKYTYTLNYDANGGTGAPSADSWSTTDASIRYHSFTVKNTIPTREGYVLKGWKANDGSDTIYTGGMTCAVSQYGNDVVKNGNTWTRTLYAVWEEDAPAQPTPLDEAGVKALLGENAVQIICTNAQIGHGSRTFGLIDGTFTIRQDNNRCEVVINDFNSYVSAFNAAVNVPAGTHITDNSMAGQNQTIINLVWSNGKWTAVDAPAKYHVLCSLQPVEPTAPDHDGLSNLIGNITVNCTNDAATHDPKSKGYALIADSYTTGNVEGSADTGYTFTVTVNAEKYVTQFDTDTSATHTPKDGSKVVTLKYENDAWTVKEGAPVSFDVACVALPTFDELKEIFNQKIFVECNTKPAHARTPYDLIADSYTIEDFSTMTDLPTCTVVLNSRKYVASYNNTTNAVHTPENEVRRVGLILKNGSWVVAYDVLPVVFQVVCVPDAPTDNYLKDLLHEKVKVACINGVHATLVCDLIDGSYQGSGVQPDGNGGYTYTVTIAAAEYVKKYNARWPHSLVKGEPAEKPVTLVWNADEREWLFADASAVPVIFNVECLYTVTYEDGVNGSVFKTVSFPNLKKGEATPTIDDPIRVGYKFAGWEPTVAKTVTGDVTYIAQWEEVDTTFTVKYNDNVKGKAFKEQVYENLQYNEETPGFYGGTPKRSGYTFTGWKPVVADRVTKDVVYYAQWKSNSGKDGVPKTGDGQIVMILGSVLLFSFCGATAVCLNDRKRKQG